MVEDYPRTLMELERRFHDEQACAEYLTRLRWPNGWRCPRCQGREAWQVRRNRWRCEHGRHEISATTGTIVQDSHLPLRTWFRAMWYVTNQKNGISALIAASAGSGQLQDRLGDLVQVAASHGPARPRPADGCC